MSWDAIEGATNYKVYRDGNEIGESDTNTFKDTGLTAATDYSYQVKAVCGLLTSELSSAAIIATKESQSG
ncbi:fibronectin type III domain-containing protein [Listeria cornellensis]|uniref:Uncharacterized protein n=1 Tax=Listeria cornellensis FSL F6-0969 TaxID=1265820 RepID=W7BV36_9LIST|nr:fibronectin type III domain-containing protein [Listeria cornellensis]EUJ29612.1 hypothetical protein PCORN_10677 [Listeria cornellensis FSL F6-0969]KGL44120.1 hypothetical protein EP58_06635 [Listeria newyorkensis]